MRQRFWINTLDIVFIRLREFCDEIKAEITMKYFDEEANELQELSEIL